MEGGRRIDTADILAKVKANPLLAGVTFSGGEPFLQPAPLAALARAVHALGLDVLAEAHDAEEVARLAALGLRVIGVNARNLRTFATDLSGVRALLAQIPEPCLAVAESAITSRADMAQVGARRFLIGEALMRRPELLPELLA